MSKDEEFKRLLENHEDPFSGEDDKQKTIQFWKQLCFPNLYNQEQATEGEQPWVK